MTIKWVGRIGMGLFLVLAVVNGVNGDAAKAQSLMTLGFVVFLAFEKMDEINRGKKGVQ